jgi:hypothetical protein
MKPRGRIISVSVVATLRVEKPRIRISIPGWGRDLSLIQNVYTGAKARLCLLGTRVLFSGVNPPGH